MTEVFPYREAFSRNIGWVTPQEQEILRHKRIAIAGMGGVGGIHLLTLARLGIGAFHIADFDEFDIVNFNRQVGATISSLGKPKVEVLAGMAKDINPELDIRIFPEGINQNNLPDFFADVDLYVDGLDFFAFSARQAAFAACAKLGIPAITAAPLGMGAALLNFLPGKMTFEEYFQWGDLPEEEKALRFLLGLAPTGLHAPYLVDPSAINLAERRGPSTIMGCQLCAGVAATEALKILLNRGKVLAAPHGLHFDAYFNKLVHTWRPGGNNNPLQWLGLLVARRRVSKRNGLTVKLAKESTSQTTVAPYPSAEAEKTVLPSVIEKILDLARWAPSGDNTQPWRFEIVDDRHLVVHGFDTRDHCVYDLDGHPSQISLGALLETISIAATGHGLLATIIRRAEMPETTPTFDIRFVPDQDLKPDSLIPYITCRSVQRRAMKIRPLGQTKKRALETAIGEKHTVLWLEGAANRWAAARLMFNNAKLRLTLPEAYQVHRDIIHWNARFSDDRIPDQALGLDSMTLRTMHWVMQSWRRVKFFNTFLGGTWAPRIQMDLIPGIACAAHFVIIAEHAPERIDDYVSAGRAVQRFWLTATKLGLQLQPEMTPLIFSRYARDGIKFSAVPQVSNQSQKIALQLKELIGKNNSALAVFIGRIGSAPSPESRSLRLSLSRLKWKGRQEAPRAKGGQENYS
jgi:molybdopterin/thiamine biosynthesis adenylyltransferase